MKTQFLRVWTLSVATSSLVVCAGCEEDNAKAETPQLTNTVSTNVTAASTNPVVTVTSAAAPQPPTPDPEAVSEAAPPVSESAPENLEDPGPAPEDPTARIVQKPVLPETLTLSPALAEIIKLVQAGVSDEVMLAYIINSTNVFHLGSDQIVYLNDLGVSVEVVTALIEKDGSPEALAQKQAANSVTPLPPGVALNTPATNIYPPASSLQEPVAEASLEPPTYVSEPAAPETVTEPPVEQPASVSYFYSSLAPYGSWVDVSGYGLCWQPTVAVVNPSWRPYGDGGRWLWSNHGWYWYSDYSWGWAPFHYGRWCSYPSLGWVWRPDTVWGPSWVSWRYTPYHCGWAPLPPYCSYVNGFGLYYQNGSVGASYGFGLGAHCYTYLPINRFCDRYPHHYYLSSGHAHAIHKKSTVINNYVTGDNNTIINEGIGKARIGRLTRGEIPEVTVREAPLTPVGSSRPERLEREGKAMVVVRPKLPPASVPRAGTAGVASKADVAANAASADNRSPTPPARSAPVTLASPKNSDAASLESSTGPSVVDRPPARRPVSPTSLGAGAQASAAGPSQDAPASAPSEKAKGLSRVPDARPQAVVLAEAGASSPTTGAGTVTKSSDGVSARRPVIRSARPSASTATADTADPSTVASAPKQTSVARPQTQSIRIYSSGGVTSTQLTPPQPLAAPQPVASPTVSEPKSAPKSVPVRPATRTQSSASRVVTYPGADVGRPASVASASPAVVNRPANQPQISRPSSAASALSRSANIRVYAEPARTPAVSAPAPARSATVVVPATRPSFSAPSRIAAPSVRSVPVARAEPVRPQVSAPSRVYSAPTPSVQAASPQTPSPSGGRGRAEFSQGRR